MNNDRDMGPYDPDQWPPKPCCYYCYYDVYETALRRDVVQYCASYRRYLFGLDTYYQWTYRHSCPRFALDLRWYLSLQRSEEMGQYHDHGYLPERVE